MMILKDIKEYTKIRKAELKEKVSQMTAAPRLAIVQVGEVEASTRYVRNKIKILYPRQIIVKIGIIGNIRNLLFALDRLVFHRFPTYENLTFVKIENSCHAFERRRFPCAVVTDKRANFPCLDLQA